MHKTTLRKVGGSVMLAVPPALLAEAGLAPGASVAVSVSGGKLVVERRRPRYTLAELVKEHEALVARELDDRRAWLDAPSVGREEI